MISVDFETYSPVDLKNAGLYRYCEHPDTDILCMVLQHDGKFTCWMPGDPVPSCIQSSSKFRAWNAQFERNIWNTVLVKKYGFPPTTVHHWQCTAAQAYAVGAPYALDKAALFFGMEQKKSSGHVMKRLSQPGKDGKRITPTAGELQELLAYCKQDVVVESALADFLPPLSDAEQRVYRFDQVINGRGIYCDLDLAKQAADFWDDYLPKLDVEIQALTDGISGTRVAALTEWLRQNGVPLSTLAKGTIVSKLDAPLPKNVERVLRLRLEIGSTAVKKFTKFPVVACADSRIRGMFRYHGASTGRWTGNLVQVQNLPRGNVPEEELPLAMSIVRSRTSHAVIRSIWGDNLGQWLGSLCRPVLQAAPGKKLVVGDFASVEARCVAWLAGQADLVGMFAQGVDAYKYMASKIYSKPIEHVNKSERFLGKTAVLGCGYGLGHDKFKSQLKQQANIDIAVDLAKRCVCGYRDSYPKIVKLWKTIEHAFRKAITNPENRTPVTLPQGCSVQRDGDWVFITLPSSRRLAYYKALPDMTFQGATSSGGFWRESTYGGKLTENICSGICRDLLVFAMFNLDAAGYTVIGSVHDEIICEVPDEPKYTPEGMLTIATQLPYWAANFPLAGEAWEGKFYHK
jgi:DNA polymerase